MSRFAAVLLVSLLAPGCGFVTTGEGGGDSSSGDPGLDDTGPELPVDPDADPDLPVDGSDGSDPVDVPPEDPGDPDLGPWWLGDWARRVMLVVDRNDVPEPLTDFPLLVHLGAEAGRDAEDVSFVFDELTTADLRHSIAVTLEDGITECHVEIDRWDQDRREAWLWVGIPYVSHALDTVLYLYFDAAMPANLAYVGDTDSPQAEAVWNAGYQGVWHLGEGAGADAFDSTLHNNHGDMNRTNHWMPEGGLAGTYDFDGLDDHIDCGNDPSLRPVHALTLEAWLYVGEFSDWEAAVAQQFDTGSSESGWWLGSRERDGPLNFWVRAGSSGWVMLTTPFSEVFWRHVVGVYDGANVTLYVDAVAVASAPASGPIDYDPVPYGLYIGRYHDDDEDFHMLMRIDEVRVSDVARSEAWVRASFESQRDHTIDFGTLESL